MEFNQLIGYLAPLIVIFITQGLKAVMATKYAPLLVVLLGGLSALLNVGPAPGGEFVDGVVNAGWVSGLATLIYDIFKKATGGNT